MTCLSDFEEHVAPVDREHNKEDDPRTTGDVTVGRNEWHDWKEEKKFGGGAHQGQSDWSKITGVTDL
ncbi:hypothetical protein PPACK8108_LOCUS15772 [Phakopsora pachyrhizi]|uniref:Uncharacterized protein n=1 Tax=Phakopsora pachyrhizi TaxID=170000 RepID=A0AAV0B9B3_PHAPC|nr:hypothetical protein PPACK8108_LOCUS15772 [Phakopsora pachyrhizi]